MLKSDHVPPAIVIQAERSVASAVSLHRARLKLSTRHQLHRSKQGQMGHIGFK